MDIKVLQKSNTFSTLSTGGSKIGSWFDRRARKLSMKCSKSISVLGKTKLYFIRSCNYSRCKYEIFQSTISVVDSICPFNCLISNPLSILLLSKVDVWREHFEAEVSNLSAVGTFGFTINLMFIFFSNVWICFKVYLEKSKENVFSCWQWCHCHFQTSLFLLKKNIHCAISVTS